jgi:uncharacterized protein (TIGR00730 family)
MSAPPAENENAASSREIERVLVFCASSKSADPVFREAAATLGRVLARSRHSVVYGGGAEGSMGALADAALGEGARVVGIQPRFMAEREWTHPGLSELHLVETMAERKHLMLASCDAIVTLPGGSGTLDEVFEAITAKRLGLFLGPIVFINQGGFFDPCLTQLEHCVQHDFMDRRHAEMWSVVSEPEQVPAAFAAAPPWSENAVEFAAV